jgi:assimilatory nitrate reductase catalytic subunit
VARGARVDALANPAVDPISGQPELKHTPVRLEPAPMAWHGFIVSRIRLEVTAADYWVAIKRAGGWRFELAGRRAAPDGGALLRAAFGDGADYCEVSDGATGLYRGAALDESGLLGCLFIGAPALLPPRAWLDSLLGEPADALDPLAVLAGRPPDSSASGLADGGPTICACFGVGERRLVQAIVEQGCSTTDAIGTRLRAGTNCGSCLPEIRALLARHREPVTV